jgi:hypothetical protein
MGMTLDREPVVTEFTAPPIKLEDYVQRPEWAALPIQIKLAIVHLWRTENDPPLTADDAGTQRCGARRRARPVASSTV